MDELALALRIMEERANPARISQIMTLIRSWMRRVGLSEEAFSREELLRRMRECDDARIRVQAECLHGMSGMLVSQSDSAGTDIPERLRDVNVERLGMTITDFIAENLDSLSGRLFVALSTYCHVSHHGSSVRTIRDLVVNIPNLKELRSPIWRDSRGCQFGGKRYFGEGTLKQLIGFLRFYCNIPEIDKLTPADYEYLRSLELSTPES